MRRKLPVAVIFLAACGAKTASNEATVAGNELAVSGAANKSGPAAAATRQEAGRAAADEADAVDRLGTLPPADAALRFVGTWAASRSECTTRPWRFTADGLTATDGPHCTFYKVTKAPAGYDIAAQCPAKEPVHTDLLNLRFAESARAMLVESNAIKPIGLIYCGK